MTEDKICKLATEYALRCDPLNQTLEKQADIRQGFIAGMTQALNIGNVVKCNCPKESTDIYDEFGNLLGWACLECGIVEQ